MFSKNSEFHLNISMQQFPAKWGPDLRLVVEANHKPLASKLKIKPIKNFMARGQII